MSEIITSTEQYISSDLIANYFRNLVNRFFKILPMRENNESSLDEYIQGFQRELIGVRNFVPDLKENPQYLTLLAILQYLIDNINDSSFTHLKVRREVFKAISVCEKLKSVYASMEVSE